MKSGIRELKKGIALLMIVMMVLTLFPVSSYAFQATDLSKHWAKDIIEPWVDQNLVKGYEDGTFRPDNNITRAEFMSLVNGAFGFTKTEEIKYIDVEQDGWYKEAIAVAKAAAYISGYPDNTMRPNHPIGRAEAASIIMKICSLETESTPAVKFTDESSFGWAKAAINAVAAANIMNGYPDGSFQSQRFIKRAEAVAALDKALAFFKGNHTYQNAGIYGPSNGSEQIEGNVTVSGKDIVLQNLVIQGDLTIGKNVGDGTVTLKNITVKGKTIINGGGENSILVIDSSLGTVTVSKEDGKIRIVVSGNTSVNLVQALSGVKLEEKDLSDGSPGFKEIILDASDEDRIVLNGSFDKVTVASEDLKLQLAKGSAVETLIVNKKVSITGNGTVGTALIHASGVAMEMSPKVTKVDQGIDAPTIGETAASGGGGGGGGGGVQPQPAIAVEEVSIFGNLFVGQVLTAKLKPEAATASYQWMRANASDGTYQDIPGAIGKTYQLTDTDYNQYIKVKIEGNGDYTGTKISNATAQPVGKEKTPTPTITPSKTTAVNRESGINFTIDTVDGVTYYYTLDGSRPTAESSRYQGSTALTAPDQDGAVTVTISVIGVKAGSFDSELATATVTYSAKETVARPTITPSKTTAVNRESGINFTIDAVDGVTYYYTLDGSRPTAESSRYQGSTALTAPDQDGAVTVTISVIGVKAGSFDSELATATVTYRAKETVARPTITPSKTTAVNRESGINFTIDAVDGVTYYYTLDGSTPTVESSRYQGSTALTSPDQDGAVTVTISVIGMRTGSFDSELATATVTYSAKETVARPTITPSKTTAVNRESGINFTIDAVDGVTYYYTLDGSTPTVESSRYQGSTALTSPDQDGAVTVTISVIGMKNGSFDSELATATVTYSAKETVARPTITPSKTTAVNRESGINFTIDAVDGVTYYYTLDGSRPTAESSRYQESTALTAPDQDGAVTVTISVIGMKAGSFDSEVATATVTYSASVSQEVRVIFLPAVAASGGTYFPSQGYSVETINQIEESLWGLADPFTLSTAAGPLEIKQIFSTSNGGGTLTINADNVTQSFLDWLEHDLATSGRKALQIKLSTGSATFYQDPEDRNITNGSEGTPLFLLLSDYPDWEGTTIRINFHDLILGENRGELMLTDGTEAPFAVETIGNLKPADSIRIDGSSTIEEDNGELQLSAEVLPLDAYDKTVRWSVVNGTGYARISNSGNGTTGRVYAGKNGTVDVYATSAQDGALVSAPFTITITGQVGPAAPTGINVINESTMGADDGGLTGVAPGQEYQLVGTDVWTTIIGSTVTGLTPGSYIVRVAETEMQPAGMQTEELIVEGGSDVEVPKSTVERDSEETGGSSVTFDPSTFTFNGSIAYYEQADSIGGDRPGNYIGVKITASESIDVDRTAATFNYTDTDGNEQTLVNGTTSWMSGDDYMYYYPLVTSSNQTFTVIIDWDGAGTAYAPETIVFRVNNAILLPADPLPPGGGGSGAGTEPGADDDNAGAGAENDSEQESDLLPAPGLPIKEEPIDEPANNESMNQEVNKEMLTPGEQLLMSAPNTETSGLMENVPYGRGTLTKPIARKK